MGLMGFTPRGSKWDSTATTPNRNLVNSFQNNGLRDKLEKLNRVHKNVSYRSMSSMGWIFNLKSATRDMSLERF
jgi:hypothetical protein